MKILIIEDDLAIRNTLQDLLELNGHTVLAAADGSEGVRLAERRPDLIFCDMVMPGMDGDEVIVAIRQLPYCLDIPFIFLTALTDRADQRLGMSLGADDYITKPFSERDILDAVAARVRRQQPLLERVKRLLAERRMVADAPWSHELMTPLCGVLGGLELIEAEADTIQPGELKGLLRIIRGGAERQQALSNKLVLYFDLERLRAARSPKTFRCDHAPEAIAAGAVKAAMDANRSPDLTVQCGPGSVPLAEAHILAAVAELVGNAFRFSKPGSPVSVTGTRHGARYQIEIADQGSGMTAEERAGVDAFKQFGRGKREQQGMGLGLAIARSVAEIAGGHFGLQAGSGDLGLKAILDLPCS